MVAKPMDREGMLPLATGVSVENQPTVVPPPLQPTAEACSVRHGFLKNQLRARQL